MAAVAGSAGVVVVVLEAAACVSRQEGVGANEWRQWRGRRGWWCWRRRQWRRRQGWQQRRCANDGGRRQPGPAGRATAKRGSVFQSGGAPQSQLASEALPGVAGRHAPRAAFQNRPHRGRLRTPGGSHCKARGEVSPAAAAAATTSVSAARGAVVAAIVIVVVVHEGRVQDRPCLASE
jgi:hypothetical protein